MSGNSWVKGVVARRKHMKEAAKALPVHLVPFAKPVPYCQSALELIDFKLEEMSWWRHYDRIKGIPSPPSLLVPLEYRSQRKDRSIFDAIRLIDKICRYCLERPTETVDHIHPYCFGGTSTFSNLVGACEECNGRKSNMFLSESGMELHWPDRFNRHDPTPLWFHRMPKVFSWKWHKFSLDHDVHGLLIRLHDNKSLSVVLERSVHSAWRQGNTYVDENNYLIRDFIANFPWYV